MQMKTLLFSSRKLFTMTENPIHNSNMVTVVYVYEMCVISRSNELCRLKWIFIWNLSWKINLLEITFRLHQQNISVQHTFLLEKLYSQSVYKEISHGIYPLHSSVCRYVHISIAFPLLFQFIDSSSFLPCIYITDVAISSILLPSCSLI